MSHSSYLMLLYFDYKNKILLQNKKIYTHRMCDSFDTINSDKTIETHKYYNVYPIKPHTSSRTNELIPYTVNKLFNP